VAELVRWPAALSVPGDVLLGAAAAGWPAGRRTPGLVGASCCLYWAGMALNDWADRDVDAVERPGRPIPSGRVHPAAALALGAGLTAAGLGLAALSGGRRSLAVAVPLAATVWTYDLGSRRPPLAPAAMVAARALDVLLGAGGRPVAIPAAGTVAAHTAVVMGLSAVEVTGGPLAARRARAALAGTTAVTLLATHRPPAGGPASPTRPARRPAAPGAAPWSRAGGLVGLPAVGLWRLGAGPRPDLLATALLGAYAGVVGAAQLAAARDPRPATVQKAVGAGVLGVVPLQAALLARTGARVPALAVAVLWPAARRLSRRVSPT
jgi:4-hydroxybenzoate polyprenyltransferase